MNSMEPLHRFEIFGLVAQAATPAEAQTIVAKLLALSELARQAEHLPALLTRLEESQRRFDDVRRFLGNAENVLQEAKRHATTELELEPAHA